MLLIVLQLPFSNSIIAVHSQLLILSALRRGARALDGSSISRNLRERTPAGQHTTQKCDRVSNETCCVRFATDPPILIERSCQKSACEDARQSASHPQPQHDT
jgi:hypothetical protein